VDVVQVVITIIVTAIWLSIFGAIGWIARNVLGIRIGDDEENSQRD